MALVQKKNPRQNTLLLVLLVVVLVGGGATYWYLRPDTTATNTSGGSSSRDPEIFSDFGQDLYTTEQFQSLHDYSKDVPSADLTPTPIPVPLSDLINAQVDLPPNTQIGNPDPFGE